VHTAWQNLNIGNRMRTTDAVVIKLKLHYSAPSYKLSSDSCHAPFKPKLSGRCSVFAERRFSKQHRYGDDIKPITVSVLLYSFSSFIFFPFPEFLSILSSFSSYFTSPLLSLPFHIFSSLFNFFLFFS